MSKSKKKLLILMSITMIFLMGTVIGAAVNNYSMFQRGEKINIETWLNGYNIDVDDVRRATSGYTYTYKDGSVSEASIYYNGEVYLPIRKMAEFTDTFYALDGTNIIFDTDKPYQGEGIATDSNDSTSTNETTVTSNIEWKYGGYESVYPYKEYEYKWINGVKTTEYRYTGTNAAIGIFRGQSFGTTKATVKSLETVPLFDDQNNVLQYNTTVAGVDSSVMYSFNSSNQLYQCGAVVSSNYYDDNLYIDDYYDYLEALTEKYGEPKTNEILWKDDLFKGDPNDYGLAVSIGDLAYYAQWDFDDFDIMVLCSGKEYNVTTGFLITSKIYSADEKPSGL